MVLLYYPVENYYIIVENLLKTIRIYSILTQKYSEILKSYYNIMIISYKLLKNSKKLRNFHFCRFEKFEISEFSEFLQFL